jgi:ribonuclease HII
MIKNGLNRIVCGVDEAGRGTLAGPVVASAVILPIKHNINGLKDSKKLSSKKRENLSIIIQKKALSIGISIIDVPLIDKINIRQATLMAMAKSVRDLSVKPEIIYVDGKDKINTFLPQKTFIKGDSKKKCIMAASIIAKVHRDQLMEIYSKKYPSFGFEKNKGYGTKYHLDALIKNNPTPIHRKSFRPLKFYY